jgi:hypothetical protein
VFLAKHIEETYRKPKKDEDWSFYNGFPCYALGKRKYSWHDTGTCFSGMVQAILVIGEFWAMLDNIG